MTGRDDMLSWEEACAEVAFAGGTRAVIERLAAAVSKRAPRSQLAERIWHAEDVVERLPGMACFHLGTAAGMVIADRAATRWQRSAGSIARDLATMAARVIPAHDRGRSLIVRIDRIADGA